jgi:hypothetical protein
VKEKPVTASTSPAASIGSRVGKPTGSMVIASTSSSFGGEDRELRPGAIGRRRAQDAALQVGGSSTPRLRPTMAKAGLS